jgi:CheY-like chemotaxis protein
MSKILLVDDDDLVRLIIAEILTDAGHTVVEANDGDQVLPMLAREHPDLLITDLMMPGQEGMETIVSLRKTYPMLPIIAISGRAEYIDIAKVLGANGGLVKPVMRDPLLAMIGELVDPVL